MPRVTAIRSDAGSRASFTASSAAPRGAEGIVRSSTQDIIVLPAAATHALASSFTANAAHRLSNSTQRGLRLRLAADARGLARSGRFELPAGPGPGAAEADPPQTAPPETAPGNSETDPSILKKYAVHIESLENFELLRYIPVTIEPLGERVFVAEASELNLSMTGRSPDDAVRLLKDVITRTYDANRTRRNTLDAERRRQQRILETYIGKPKGVWHWA